MRKREKKFKFKIEYKIKRVVNLVILTIIKLEVDKSKRGIILVPTNFNGFSVAVEVNKLYYSSIVSLSNENRIIFSNNGIDMDIPIVETMHADCARDADEYAKKLKESLEYALGNITEKEMEKKTFDLEQDY